MMDAEATAPSPLTSSSSLEALLSPLTAPNSPSFLKLLVPSWGGITIVKLRKSQEVKLRAIARNQIGKDHARWSPVATVTFMYEPEIHINEDLMEILTLEEKREWVESSPTPVFYIDPITQ